MGNLLFVVAFEVVGAALEQAGAVQERSGYNWLSYRRAASSVTWHCHSLQMRPRVLRCFCCSKWVVLEWSWGTAKPLMCPKPSYTWNLVGPQTLLHMMVQLTSGQYLCFKGAVVVETPL